MLLTESLLLRTKCFVDQVVSRRQIRLAVLAFIVGTGLCACAMMRGRPESPSMPPEPTPAPGRVLLKSRNPDPTLRASALAGGHPMSPDKLMKLHVILTNLHEDELESKLKALGDLNSPLFGKQLTREELERYERPQSDYEAVEEWLNSYGIRILDDNRSAYVRTIRAEGMAAQIEAALIIQICQSANGAWFANMSDPQIPAHLKGMVAGFIGLDNLVQYAGGPATLLQ